MSDVPIKGADAELGKKIGIISFLSPGIISAPAALISIIHTYNTAAAGYLDSSERATLALLVAGGTYLGTKVGGRLLRDTGLVAGGILGGASTAVIGISLRAPVKEIAGTTIAGGGILAVIFALSGNVVGSVGGAYLAHTHGQQIVLDKLFPRDDSTSEPSLQPTR